MYFRRVFLAFVLLAAFAMLAMACSSSSSSSSTPPPTDDDTSPAADDDGSPDDDDDSSPSPAEPYCDAGKNLLLVGEGSLAALQFQQGLTVDETAANCRYGLMLADCSTQLNTASILVTYVEAAVKGYQPPTRDEPQTGQSFINALLNIIVNSAYLDAANDAVTQAEWVRNNAPDMVYPLDHLPVIFNFAQVADAHGNYDMTDAVAAEAWSGAIGGILSLVPAMNLDFELGLIFSFSQVSFSPSFTTGLGELVNLLLQLFDNPLFPNFFTPIDGGAPYQAAGLMSGLGLLHASETFSWMTKDSGNPATEVLGYDDANGNHQWDQSDPLVVPPWGALDTESNNVAWAAQGVFLHLANSFLEYTAYDTDPGVPQPFKLSYLNPLLEAFGLPGLIPDWSFLEIDFGKSFHNADSTSLRDEIVAILKILHLLFPGN